MHKDNNPRRRKNCDWRKNIKWVLISASTIFVLVLVLSPIKNAKADSYLDSGDQFLAQKKYISAIVEYKKSHYLQKDNEVRQRIDLAKNAQRDVLELENFYRQRNDIDQLNYYHQAKDVPESEYDLVAKAKWFIEQGEPQLAQVATFTACEMDSDYRDAWLYLGIAHFETVTKIELSKENYHHHINQSKSALEKALEIDPNYQPTKDYFEAIESIS